MKPACAMVGTAVAKGMRFRRRMALEPKNEGAVMGETSLIRTALLVALIAAFGLVAAGRAPAAEMGAVGCVAQLPSALTSGLTATSDCFQPFCSASICRR